MTPVLTIEVHRGPSATRFAVRPGGETPVLRLLQGRSRAEAHRLIGLVFNLCPMAQGAAAAMAMDLALPVSIHLKIALETLREHALVMLRDWPAALGVRPDANGLTGLAALSADSLDGLEQALYGGPARVVVNDFEHWMHRSAAGPALDLASVAEWPKHLGCIDVERDPTFLARVARQDAVRRIVEGEGVTLFARMAARALEAALVIEEIRSGKVATRCGTSGHGEGWAEAARGRLTHSVRVHDDRVANYRIGTPTDAMAGNGAFLEALLQSACGTEVRGTGERLAIALSCADPCLPVVWQEQTAGHA